MSTSLYELNKEYLNLITEVIDEETGEIVGEELNIKKLEEIQDKIEVKVENIAVLIKNEKATAEMIDSELKRLTNRKRIHQNRAKNYENYLINNAYGTDIETSRAKVKFKIGTGRVHVTNMELVPKEFIKVTYSEDKMAIKKLLKNGTSVSGCELIYDKKVNIK